MLLSMSMLAERLKDYDPECYLREDAMVIHGVRFLNDPDVVLSEEYAYIAPAELFFADEAMRGSYLVASGRSRILCRGVDYERLLNDLLGAFDYYMDWEKSLIDLAARHASLQELLDAVATIVENPFFVSEEDGSSVLASCFPEGFPLDPHWEYIRENGSIAPQSILAPLYDEEGELEDYGDRPKLVRSPEMGSSVGQYLMLDGERVAFACVYAPDESKAQMLIQLADVVARYLVMAEEFTGPAARIRSAVSLLGGLLASEDVEDAALARFFKNAPAAPWRFLIVEAPDVRVDSRRRSMLHYLHQQPGGCEAFYQDELYVLVHGIDVGEFVAGFMNSPGCKGVRIGASAPFADIRSLPSRRQQARFALGEGQGKPGPYLCEDYAFDYLLRSLATQQLTRELLHPAIDQLEKYDTENGADLLATLCAYLEGERKLLEVSEGLHVHRNTLKYRVGRIRELTGIDFEDARERDYLTLSCRIMQVGFRAEV